MIFKKQHESDQVALEALLAKQYASMSLVDLQTMRDKLATQLDVIDAIICEKASDQEVSDDA